jgi:hypothetical protein
MEKIGWRKGEVKSEKWEVALVFVSRTEEAAIARSRIAAEYW